MSRVVIQVGQDRVAYDGRDWTPVAGDRAEGLARILKSGEYLYTGAASHPDRTYNVAEIAAREHHGEIVEYEPGPNAFDPEVIY